MMQEKLSIAVTRIPWNTVTVLVLRLFFCVSYMGDLDFY